MSKSGVYNFFYHAIHWSEGLMLATHLTEILFVETVLSVAANSFLNQKLVFH
jgi:hypothetical protein